MRPQLSGFSRTHPKTNTRVGAHLPFLCQIRSGIRHHHPNSEKQVTQRQLFLPAFPRSGGKYRRASGEKAGRGGRAASRPGARHWRLNIKCREKSISTALLAISDASFQRERFEFRDGALPLFSCPAAFGASVDGTTGRG